MQLVLAAGLPPHTASPALCARRLEGLLHKLGRVCMGIRIHGRMLCCVSVLCRKSLSIQDVVCTPVAYLEYSVTHQLLYALSHQRDRPDAHW